MMPDLPSPFFLASLDLNLRRLGKVYFHFRFSITFLLGMYSTIFPDYVSIHKKSNSLREFFGLSYDTE